MRTLALDPRSIILPMKAGLRIYSTQGTVELRSKNLSRVHEILQGRLAGQYSEKALIAAVPFAQRVTVRRYLRVLRDAGAIQFDKNSAARYFRQPAEKAAKHRLRTRMSETSGDDQLRGSKHASLQYITRQDFASLVVRKARDPSRRQGAQIYVLMDESWTGESGSEGCLGRLPTPNGSSAESFLIEKSRRSRYSKSTKTPERLRARRRLPERAWPQP